MTLIFSYQNITKSYGGTPLFRDLSLHLKEDERLGLVGTNGCGKSTLLKLIAGEDTPDSGDVYSKKHLRLVYLPQEDTLDPDKTVGQILLGESPGREGGDPDRYRRAQKIMGTGAFTDETQRCRDLSGGWKKRLSIVQALSRNPDLLLLDEPTNHLDIHGILWLEEVLQNASFAFVVVSHDRCFLDNTCKEIMELGKFYPDEFMKVAGGYDRFVETRKQFLESQLKQEAVLSNKMRRETEWLRQGAKARTTKAKYRIENAGKLEDELLAVKQRNQYTGTVDIDFDATYRKTKKLLVCRNIGKSIQGRLLFDDISFELTPGSRLGLVGGNGSGKTTFMSILENRLSPDTGDIMRAENLRVAVFDQTRSRLDPDMTLRQALSPAGDSLVYRQKSVHVVTWAKRFLFTPDQLLLPVSQLSGGEKARILIAELMRQPADLLLLDEPTNDLDIPSLEVLEDSLLDFPGAIVVVSHDRRLLDRVTNRVLYLDGKGGSGMFADYSQCLNSLKPERKKAKKAVPTAAKPQKQRIAFSYKDKYELEQMEGKILEAEQEAESLLEKTMDPDIMKDPAALRDCYSRLQKAQETVDRLYARWEELETLKQNSE